MKKALQWTVTVIKILVGCAVFGLGFNLFLAPNGLNAGGISGISMLIVHVTSFGSVGLITILINLPLFALAGMKIGRKFFFLSMLGMACASLSIDLFALLPKPETEPLVGALYGGAMCGLGLGIVFSTGGSTGGSDIIVRLLKMKWSGVPIGTINIAFDFTVVALTGLVFRDMGQALYCGVAIFLSGKVMDAVIYSFDYSTVALVISREHDAIAKAVRDELGRGVTFLYGEGSYTNQETKVILTAVRKQQLAELKRLVVREDPDAFIIVQEAHQVLGDGFLRYSKDSL